MREGRMAMAWSDLTYEVLLDVFSRLDFEGRYTVVSLVCRPWYRASRDASCWGSADMEDCFAKTVDSMSRWWTSEFEQKMDKMITNVVDWSQGSLLDLHTRHCSDQALLYVAARCPLLRSLSIKESPKFTDSSATEIAASCRKLQYVDISECQNVSGMFLKDLGRNCQELVTLKRNRLTVDWYRRQHIPVEYLQAHPNTTPDDEANFIGTLMQNLRHLELRHNSGLSDKGLSIIVQGCPGLECLDLDGCGRLSIMAVELSVLKLRHLRHFTRPSVPINYISSVRYGHWQLYSDRFQSF